MARRVHDERGLALLVAVVATTLLMAIALALALTSGVEVGAASNHAVASGMLYGAEAGLERALVELLPMSDWNPVLQGLQASSSVDGPPGGARVLGDGTRVDPTEVANGANCGHVAPCTDDEMIAVSTERPWGLNNPRWRLYAYAPLSMFLGSATIGAAGYVVVLVADDPSEIDGNVWLDGAFGDPGSGIIFVRAEALGAAGAHAVVEATVFRAEASARARVASWRAIR